MESTQKIIKRISKIAFPMTAARIINMISIFIGMIMISRLGHEALAAGALITAVFYTVVVIFMCFLFSVGVVTGRYFGAKRFFEIGDVLQQALMLSVLLSIPMMLFFWNAGSILLYFGQDPALVVYVKQFFQVLTWIALPMLFQICFSQFMVAASRVVHVVCACVFSVFVFLIVAYMYVFGNWGAARHGIAGVAYGLIAQECVSLLYLLIAYFLDKSMHRHGVFTFKRVRDWSIVKKLIHVGWPMSIQFGGEIVGISATTMFVGLLGVSSLAAWQVVQQVLMIFVIPVYSLSEAAAIIVGQTVGSKQYLNLKKVNWITLIAASFFLLIGASIFVIMPNQLTTLYMSQQHVHYGHPLFQMIATLFFINAFVYVFDGLRNLFSGSLRGLYDTRFPMIAGLISVWVIGVGLGYCFAFYTKLGLFGFSIAQVIGFSLGALALYIRWHFKVKTFLSKP